MSYYLHRISHEWEWSHPLLTQGNVLSIGYSDYGTNDFVRQHEASAWEEVAIAIQDDWEEELGYRSKAPHSLQRFLQMNCGDKVIVPDWGTFHVYEIESVNLIPEDLQAINLNPNALSSLSGTEAEVREGKLRNCETNEVIDLGFFRKVTPIQRDISRADYADANLTRRLKARQTTLDVNDLETSIDQAIERARNSQPINLRSSVMKGCTEYLIEIIWNDLDDVQFEHLIKKYFCSIGGDAEVQPKNNRKKMGDVDIIALFETLKVIIYVQAKHHDPNSSTDDWAVEQVVNYANSKESDDEGYASICWVLSLAKEFSEPCRELARKEGVRLVNGLEFAEMLLDSGMEPYSYFPSFKSSAK